MDFEQAPLYAERLELFRGRVSSELWSYFIANSFYYLVFTFSYLLVGIKLTSTAVFSIVFALFLRSILIVRIRNVFKYQRIWKSYIVSGAVILLWSIYALYSSGYSFIIIFPLCFVIPGLLAYYFRGRLVDIQAVYLAWSGYNVVLFFFLLLLFSLQSFLVFFSFLIHIVPLSWLIYSLVNATKFLKRGDAWGLTMDATLHYSISRAAFFVLGTTFYGRMLSGIMAEIPGESASFFDARFMFYALLVCSSAEEFLFRLYTKMWDKLTKRQSGASGRVIN